MSADRREYPRATSFENGRQNLIIANAGATPASTDPNAPRPNLYIVFENLDRTDSFFITVFMTGRPIKNMHHFVSKLYTACGLKPYVWKNTIDPDEGYLAVAQLFGQIIDATIEIRPAKDGFMRPEIIELHDPPLPDDDISDVGSQAEQPQAEQPEEAEPEVEPEHPKLDVYSLAYHMSVLHNYYAEHFRAIYRLVVEHKNRSDVGLKAIEAKITDHYKKLHEDLGLGK